jgi:hypothetical protein
MLLDFVSQFIDPKLHYHPFVQLMALERFMEWLHGALGINVKIYLVLKRPKNLICKINALVINNPLSNTHTVTHLLNLFPRKASQSNPA